MPHSKEKVKRRAVIFHCKARFPKAQRKSHDRMAIENREKHVESKLNVGEAEVSNNLKMAKEKCK